MQADRLTPAQLRFRAWVKREIARWSSLDNTTHTLLMDEAESLEEEAARREAEGKPHVCTFLCGLDGVYACHGCGRKLINKELGRASVADGAAPPATAPAAPQGERQGPDSAATPVRGTAAPDLVAHAAESNAPLWIAPNGTGFVHVGFTLAEVRPVVALAYEVSKACGRENIDAHLFKPFLPLLKEPRDGE